MQVCLQEYLCLHSFLLTESFFVKQNYDNVCAEFEWIGAD